MPDVTVSKHESFLPKTQSKVIMVGGGAKQRYFKDDKKAEIWCVNGQMCSLTQTWLPRCDRAFNLHRYALLKQYKYSFDNEADWVRENPLIPFYTMDKWPKWFVPNWTNWQQFPLRTVTKMPRGMYHCGSFDWLIAFAVVMGFKEIELHGINLNLEATEPQSSAACIEYWCGYAEGKGIKITQKADCSLFVYAQKLISNITYGIDDAPIYRDLRESGMGQYDYGA